MERHFTRLHPPPVQPERRWDEEPRLDAAGKVTGSAPFLDDLPTPEGCLYAATIRARGNHLSVDDIDVDGLLKMDGVVEVLTGHRLLGANGSAPINLIPHGGRTGPVASQGILPTDRVRFDGEPVGLVAATSPELARAAARQAHVVTRSLPSVLTIEEALAPDAPLLHESVGSNIAYENDFAWGDVEQGFADADVIVDVDYFGGSAFHRPLEPCTGVVVEWLGDELQVWLPTNHPFNVGPQVQAVFGIPADRVRVRVPYIGGGFGGKKHSPLVMGAVALCQATGRPVKLLVDDGESFRAVCREATRYVGRVGAKRTGEITALDVRLSTDVGAYFTGAALVVGNANISAWGCYRIPHFRVRSTAVYTNKVPASAFRATGKLHTTFGVEMLMDDLAAKLGISPVTVRKANVIRRGEFVAEHWRVGETEYVADIPPMDCDYAALIDLATDAIGWHDAESSSRVEQDDPDVLRGRGLGLSLRHGAQAGGRAYAMAVLRNDGMLEIQHNAPDLGQGVYTMLRVVAAQEMGVPQEQIVVGQPDTRNGMNFAGTSAQRTTVQMGNAVVDACRKLQAELLELAAQGIGGRLAEWEYADGRLVLGAESYSFKELLSNFRGGVQPRGIGSYGYALSEDKAFGGLDHWTPGVVAVEVEVVKATGEVRIVQCAVVGDVGKALHPTSAKRQMEGGVSMGISLALYEEMVYDHDEGLVNADAWGYRVTRMDDMPLKVTTIMVENRDGPGPFGAKGVSQTSLPCVTPAIGNAIRNAIGTPPRSSPFRPTQILDLLDKTGQRFDQAGMAHTVG